MDKFRGDARETYLAAAIAPGKRRSEKIKLTVATSLEDLFLGQANMINGMLALAEKHDVWFQVQADNDADTAHQRFLTHVKDPDVTSLFEATVEEMMRRFMVCPLLLAPLLGHL